ncbi:MAG: SGNH/GDSL hydrolase family protein [Solirubrobacterales bacterium]
MRTPSIVLVTMALLVAAVSAAPAAAAKPDTVPGQPVQLSLGDSWAFGFGATAPAENGYVPQLHRELQERYDCLPAIAEEARDHCKQLQLVNLAVGGATTPTLIQRQLPDATELLESRNADANPRDDVEVVTLHIGGNDVTNPIIAACIGGLSAQCLQTIQAEFAAYRSDLDQALSALRAAAGDEARIVIGTYDNPIATCFLGGVPGAVQLADLVLEGGPPVPQGLHDIMRDVVGDHGVEVADAFGDLGPEDWVGGQDCLHPDDSGYEKVTEAFLEVLLAP